MAKNRIDLTSNYRLFLSRQYRGAPVSHREIDKEVRNMTEHGVIQHAHSEWEPIVVWNPNQTTPADYASITTRSASPRSKKPTRCPAWKNISTYWPRGKSSPLLTKTMGTGNCTSRELKMKKSHSRTKPAYTDSSGLHST